MGSKDQGGGAASSGGGFFSSFAAGMRSWGTAVHKSVNGLVLRPPASSPPLRSASLYLLELCLSWSAVIVASPPCDLMLLRRIPAAAADSTRWSWWTASRVFPLNFQASVFSSGIDVYDSISSFRIMIQWYMCYLCDAIYSHLEW